MVGVPSVSELTTYLSLILIFSIIGHAATICISDSDLYTNRETSILQIKNIAPKLPSELSDTETLTLTVNYWEIAVTDPLFNRDYILADWNVVEIPSDWDTEDIQNVEKTFNPSWGLFGAESSQIELGTPQPFGNSVIFEETINYISDCANPDGCTSDGISDIETLRSFILGEQTGYGKQLFVDLTTEICINTESTEDLRTYLNMFTKIGITRMNKNSYLFRTTIQGGAALDDSVPIEFPESIISCEAKEIIKNTEIQIEHKKQVIQRNQYSSLVDCSKTTFPSLSLLLASVFDIVFRYEDTFVVDFSFIPVVGTGLNQITGIFEGVGSLFTGSDTVSAQPGVITNPILVVIYNFLKLTMLVGFIGKIKMVFF